MKYIGLIEDLDIIEEIEDEDEVRYEIHGFEFSSYEVLTESYENVFVATEDNLFFKDGRWDTLEVPFDELVNSCEGYITILIRE